MTINQRPPEKQNPEDVGRCLYGKRFTLRNWLVLLWRLASPNLERAGAVETPESWWCQ